ncbi:MAG TPA: hypothetical protein VFZ34_08365 [Blastocatellia bacterium]|nr:hypothetical protein [Blastocatellia bacterium]
MNVQRYFAAKDVKATVRAAFGATVVQFPVVFLLYLIGLLFVAWYAQHPELQASLTNVDRIVPHFTVNILPGGLRGLVIAGIFAATMSSMSAGINSLTTCSLKDIWERLGTTSASREIVRGRVLTLVWGLTGTFSALLVANLKLTLAERFNMIYTFFAGPLAGIFLLGVLGKRASAWPTLLGALGGFAVTMTMANQTNVHWLWNPPTGCAVTMLIGYCLSWLLPQSNPKAIARYTLVGSRESRL